MSTWSDEMKAEFAYQLLLSIPTDRTRTVVRRLTPLLHRDFLDLLPHEIALHILSYVDLPTLLQVGKVSRRWNELSQDQILWRELYRSRGWKTDEKAIDTYLSMPPSKYTFSPVPLTRSSASLYVPMGTPTSSTSSGRLRTIRRTGDIMQRLRQRRHVLHEPPSSSSSSSSTSPEEHRNLSSSILAALSEPHAHHLPLEHQTSSVAFPHLVSLAAPSSHSRSQPLVPSRRYGVGSSSTPIITGSLVARDTRVSVSSTSRSAQPQPDASESPLPSPSSCSYNRPITRRNVKYDETALYHYKEDADQRFINWRRLYRNRTLVDRRWRDGKYKMRVFPPSSSMADMHTEGIYCVQFDNDKIVSGSRDQTIKIWDIRTGECRTTLQAHNASVLCLQYDDRYILSGSSDATIIQWDVRTGDIVQILVGHGESVLNLRFAKNRLVSCSKDRTVRVWDLETGTMLRQLNGHRAAVNAVQFKDNRVVSASGDRTIKLWDMETGECLQTFESHTRGIACVEFDGSRIVSGSSDQTIKIWDVTTGDCLYTLAGHTELVRTLQIDTASDRIVSGSYDGSLKVWGLNHGNLMLSLAQAIEGRVLNLQYDYARIVCCSNQSRMVIYDFAHGIDTQFLM
ncbi:WD40-repeat-containing domain protein [Phycomyces nitens]|nr:WD40-repeat-containing domain protein [Phycomyces nitens]